jgi:drug/metabolite transporter (DMT)-like permease
MLPWITLALAAQFINAIVAVLDKYIVTHQRVMPRPFVYAFYTSLFSGLWVVIFLGGFIPFEFIQRLGIPSLENVVFPTLLVTVLALLSGYTFFAALVSLYSALRESDTSDVIPVVGAVSAIVSFFLSYLFLGTRLTPNFVLGIFLLSLGTALVSHLRFSWKTALMVVHSGIFFAAHYVVIKELFDISGTFDNGFFWSRIALVVAALSMLLVPGYFTKIHVQTKATTRRSGLLVVGNKVLAGIGSILILKATALGNVSVVQALGGLQFVFILAFSIFFGHKAPLECGEKVSCRRDMYHKIAFVSIIVAGFFMLFI